MPDELIEAFDRQTERFGFEGEVAKAEQTLKQLGDEGPEQLLAVDRDRNLTEEGRRDARRRVTEDYGRRVDEAERTARQRVEQERARAERALEEAHKRHDIRLDADEGARARVRALFDAGASFNEILESARKAQDLGTLLGLKAELPYRELGDPKLRGLDTVDMLRRLEEAILGLLPKAVQQAHQDRRQARQALKRIEQRAASARNKLQGRPEDDPALEAAIVAEMGLGG